MKLARKLEYIPQKWSLNTKIYEFLMKMIGSPKNGNLRALFVKCRGRQYALLEKRPP